MQQPAEIDRLCDSIDVVKSTETNDRALVEGCSALDGLLVWAVVLWGLYGAGLIWHETDCHYCCSITDAAGSELTYQCECVRSVLARKRSMASLLMCCAMLCCPHSLLLLLLPACLSFSSIHPS